MQEPLSKNLGFGLTARLDPDGTLTLMEVATVEIGDQIITLPTMTQVTLPAQAARALLNFLHHPDGRKRIGARKLQK